MENDFTEEYKIIGLKSAYYRKLKGLTQEELSEKTHFPLHIVPHCQCFRCSATQISGI